MKLKQHDDYGYGSGDSAFNGHGVRLHHDCCHWDGKSHD